MRGEITGLVMSHFLVPTMLKALHSQYPERVKVEASPEPAQTEPSTITF